MKRKLTPDDRKILANVFKDHEADWTYKALAVWYAAIPFEALAKVKRWTSKRLAAFRFLREIIRDYTFKAIYDAAHEIEKPGATIESDPEGTVPKAKWVGGKVASL